MSSAVPVAVGLAAGILVIIALSMSIDGSVIDSKSYAIEPPSDSWRMYSFSPDGRDPVDVWKKGFWLRIDETKIDGQICNGYGGDIRYIDSSTIEAYQVFSTSASCGALTGEESLIMGVEGAFHEGLKHGMTVSEKGNTLILRDSVTNAMFVYGK